MRKKITFVDTPGIDECDIQSILKVIEGAKSVIPIIVLTYWNFGRYNKNLKQIILFVGNMIRECKVIQNFNIVINHMPRDYTDEHKL